MTSITPISQTHDSLNAFLVEPETLLATFTDLNGLIIDARSPEVYAAGHIPGAISVSTYDYFVPNTKLEGMRAFASQAAALYGAAGMTLDTPLVVYDDDTGVRVARECWLLEYLGHRNVRLLHGGLNAWQQCGGQISPQSAAGPWPVFHHHALPQFFTDFLRQGSGEQIGRTTRGKGHDQAYRLCGIRLRLNHAHTCQGERDRTHTTKPVSLFHARTPVKVKIFIDRLHIFSERPVLGSAQVTRPHTLQNSCLERQRPPKGGR